MREQKYNTIHSYFIASCILQFALLDIDIFIANSNYENNDYNEVALYVVFVLWMVNGNDGLPLKCEIKSLLHSASRFLILVNLSGVET